MVIGGEDEKLWEEQVWNNFWTWRLTNKMERILPWWTCLLAYAEMAEAMFNTRKPWVEDSSYTLTPASVCSSPSPPFPCSEECTIHGPSFPLARALISLWTQTRPRTLLQRSRPADDVEVVWDAHPSKPTRWAACSNRHLGFRVKRRFSATMWRGDQLPQVAALLAQMCCLPPRSEQELSRRRSKGLPHHLVCGDPTLSLNSAGCLPSRWAGGKAVPEAFMELWTWIPSLWHSHK